MILAIEAGGDFVSVAVGDLRFSSTIQLDKPRNSEELLRVIDYLRSNRNEEQIEAVTVCIGPGSYTGLRVGLACAQGLACGFGVPLIGVSSFLASLFSENVIDGQIELGCLLREGEAATCKFEVSNKARIITQLGKVQVGRAQDSVLKRVDAEGLLRAAATIEDFVEFQGEDSHFIETTGVMPTPLLYLKPVQAKTLAERANQTIT